jgi:hypothetical protein
MLPPPLPEPPKTLTVKFDGFVVARYVVNED